MLSSVLFTLKFILLTHSDPFTYTYSPFVVSFLFTVTGIHSSLQPPTEFIGCKDRIHGVCGFFQICVQRSFQLNYFPIFTFVQFFLLLLKYIILV